MEILVESTILELVNGEFSTLISNFSKFKEPGQKLFTYSQRQFYTLSDDIQIFLLRYYIKAQC